jgi:hypothetical protein
MIDDTAPAASKADARRRLPLQDHLRLRFAFFSPRVRCRQLAQEPRSAPVSAITSAMGRIDPPTVRLARRSMIAKRAPAFRGKAQVGRRGAGRYHVLRASRWTASPPGNVSTARAKPAGN